jgi:hypothetical protein
MSLPALRAPSRSHLPPPSPPAAGPDVSRPGPAGAAVGWGVARLGILSSCPAYPRRRVSWGALSEPGVCPPSASRASTRPASTPPSAPRPPRSGRRGMRRRRSAALGGRAGARAMARRPGRRPSRPGPALPLRAAFLFGGSRGAHALACIPIGQAARRHAGRPVCTPRTMPFDPIGAQAGCAGYVSPRWSLPLPSARAWALSAVGALAPACAPARPPAGASGKL